MKCTYCPKSALLVFTWHKTSKGLAYFELTQESNAIQRGALCIVYDNKGTVVGVYAYMGPPRIQTNSKGIYFITQRFYHGEIN